MMNTLTFLLVAILFALGSAQKLNVLLVIIDDLRSGTGTYSSQASHTPNLDALSATSLQFDRAHAQIPQCGPSRASILTGRNPDSLNYYQQNLGSTDLDTNVISSRTRETLPSYLRREAGYSVRGVGKVFHTEELGSLVFGEDNFELSTQEHCSNSKAVCEVKSKDSEDLKAVEWAIDEMNVLRREEANWFVTVGIRKPHLPYAVPPMSFAAIDVLYPTLDDIPLPVHQQRQDDWSLQNYFCHSIEGYADVSASTNLASPYVPFDDALTRKLRRGYYAATYWADYLVGLLVAYLDEKNLTDSTLLVVTSDHGFILGEHGNWCKSSSFELATKTPLWIRDPLATLPAQHVQDVVSLVDIYPTILDLAGVAQPADGFLEGKSLAGLFRSDFTYEPSQFAFSVTGRCTKISNKGNLKYQECSVGGLTYLGYSVRTKDFRYTEWRTYDQNTEVADWVSGPVEIQLYDTRSDDPMDLDSGENVDLSSQTSPFQSSLIQALADVLKMRFNCTDSAACDFESVVLPSDTTQSPSVTGTPPVVSPVASPSALPSPVAVTPPSIGGSATLSPTVEATKLPENRSGTVSPAAEEGNQAGIVVAGVLVSLVTIAIVIVAVLTWRRRQQPKQGEALAEGKVDNLPIDPPEQVTAVDTKLPVRIA